MHACSRSRCAALFARAAASWLASCNTGTETDNPLVDFRDTACKSGMNGAALTVAPGTRQPRAEEDPEFGGPAIAGPEYDGLFCVAWDAGDGGELRVDLYNHRGGCHVNWIGHARADERGLQLDLEIAGCAIAGCGSCIYDLSFELQGIDTAAPQPLRMTELGCNGEPDEEVVDLTLPLDERPSGVLCRHAPGALIGLMPQCGRAHLPVCHESGRGGTDCSAADAPECPDGLVCGSAGSVDVCLTACSEDADCPLSIERCEEGACRLRETL